jgi:aminopeptidase N
VFLGGVRDHFDKHRYGNATMADLMEAWERAGAGDLSAFQDGWLLTAGPDRIELDRPVGVVRRTPLAGHPAERDHVLGIASATSGDGSAWTVGRAVLDADAVQVTVPDGPVVLDPHVESWAVTLLDGDTLAGLPDVLPRTADPLLRASAWLSVRNALQHALLDPEDALDLLERTIPHEDTDDGVGEMLGWALWNLAPVSRDPAGTMARIHDLAARCVSVAEPGGSLQLAAFQAQVAAAHAQVRLRDWLHGGRSIPEGVVVDLDLRWRILRTLARLGGADRDELRAALDAEPTAVSQVEHARAVASIPDAEAKAWAWQRFTGEVEVPNYELEAIGLGLWQVGQEQLTDPFVVRYFEDLPATAAVRSGWLLGQATGDFYPRWAISDETAARSHALIGAEDLDPVIRRDLVDATWDLERRLGVRKACAR